MSLPQHKLTEAKAKSKFQSLNINNIYQGAPNKNSSKSIPQKHGLQSLGKIPTARRAPANLPSVKSEKGGNDPTVVLVPTGGSGWTKDGERSGSVEKGEVPNSVPKPAPESQKEPPIPSAAQKPSGVKSWSSVTGAAQPGQQPGRTLAFGHQKSPLFGQEFPSLRTGEGGAKLGSVESDLKVQNQVVRSQHELQAGREDPANFGSGPNLRPQTYGNWTQGGMKPGQGSVDNQTDSDPIILPQPHKPVPPGALAHSHKSPPNQYKSIMPPFMDVMELPTGPTEPLGNRRISRERPGHRRESQPRGRPLQTEFTPPSIIDKEKLRRMDDLAGDDWTYDDDNFDYNKRLQSDDEDVEAESPRTDPNWADQVEKAHGTQPYNFYEEMKKPVGFGIEEDEKRRTKKSEEVIKNIERARQRREEEESRYRRPGSDEYYRGEERQQTRRFDESSKENKTPLVERKEWGFDEKRGKPRQFDDRRENRFDDRNERGERLDSLRDGYYPPRFDRKEEKARPDEYRKYDDTHDDEYKYSGRKEQVRSFDDRERNRSSEGTPPFSDFTNTDENKGERRWSGRSGRSPVYNRQTSLLSNSDSQEVELENRTSEWGARPPKPITDWVDDMESAELSERQEFETEQSSRPNSRDSRISKESRGSKEGKNSRNSVEKTKKLPEFKEEKPRKPETSLFEYDSEKKTKKAPTTDIRGYFRDTPEETKKVARQAPGPITREKLEAANHRETTGMTQLKKRDTKTEVKPVPVEPQEKLNPLLDSDMLENISDDEDGLLDTLEREDKNGGGRGRGGRGRGQMLDNRKFNTNTRGGRGMGGERPDRVERGRGTRGGRGDIRGKGNNGRFVDAEPEGEETEEMRKNRKNFEKFSDNMNQPPPVGFMPRGQPSRRGRGEGKVRGNFGGRGGMSRNSEGVDEHADEVGDWNEDEFKNRGGNQVPPRMQRKREEKGRPGKNDENEDETSSQHSNEDRRRREAERGRGRGGRGWESRGARRGGGPGQGQREQTPESDLVKKRSGIENIDLHDFASVVVVDQENSHNDQEFDQSEAGEFMQVVNRKVRPPVIREDRRSFERIGPKSGDKNAFDPRYRDPREPRDPRDSRDPRDNFNKQNKSSFERRQNKLPPRLAKVREVSRAQARSGGISPSGIEQNGWPEGDKMGVFQVEDIGTNAWEKPPPRREGSEGPDMRASPKQGKDNGGMQTMVFENTALKGGKGEKMDKSGIQMPLGLGKPEDNLDVKLDFTFGGDDLSSQGKQPLSIQRSMPHLGPQGLPVSPSTDDLSAKLANTKKLWDSPGMAVVPETPTASASWTDSSNFNENSGFEGFQDGAPVDNSGGYDKVDNGPNPGNVPKVKQQQQQQQQQHVMDQDNRPNNPMQYGRMANNAIPGAIPSPPTQMNQMGAMQPQPWAYPLDRNSTMYNPYGANQLNQSILMQGTHSIGTDLFTGSNGAAGYRLQGTGHYPGAQQNSATNHLISQANLISKHNNQIGPIGTKAGTGANNSPYLQTGLGTLPNTYIQYEHSNFNYVNPNPAGMQRGNAPPTQTAFYQSLANRQPQLTLNAAMQGSYMSQQQQQQQQQQMRANHVAGLPFLKTDVQGLGNQKSGLADNYGAGPNHNYNGRNGPPSPKTKMKMEHQQKMAAATGMNNLNSMNQLAQLRMSSLGYNIGIPGVQGYPSPIARPQMNQQTGNHGMPGKVDYYTAEGSNEEKMDNVNDKPGEGGKEVEPASAEVEQGGGGGEPEAVDPAQ